LLTGEPLRNTNAVTTCLVDAICRHVRLHMMDRDLSPEKIAAHFGISPRKLSYLFEEMGEPRAG
jgi:AraC-like DNA-binding protein